MTVSGVLSEKLSEQYQKKAALMSEFSRGYDVAGGYAGQVGAGYFMRVMKQD